MSRTEKDAPYWVKRKRAAIDRDFAKNITSSNFTEYRTYEVEDFKDISTPGSLYSQFRLRDAIFADARFVDRKVVLRTAIAHNYTGKDIETVRHKVCEYVNNLFQLSSKRAYTVDDFSAIKGHNTTSFSIGNGYLITVSGYYNPFSRLHFGTPQKFADITLDIDFEVKVHYVKQLALGDNIFKYKDYVPGVFNESNFHQEKSSTGCSCDWCMDNFNSYYAKKKLGLYGGSKTSNRTRLHDYAKVYNATAALDVLSDYIDGIDGEDSANSVDYLSLEDDYEVYEGDFEDNVTELNAEISIPDEILENIKVAA